MNVVSCAPTGRWTGCPSLASWPRVVAVAATLGVAGCNANHEVNPSSQPPSQVFAGHYEDYNPYNPISYAQNNTGRGGGR